MLVKSNHLAFISKTESTGRVEKERKINCTTKYSMLFNPDQTLYICISFVAQLKRNT